MSLRTHRTLAVAAWIAFFLFIAISAPSPDKSHLVILMLAWSVVGLAFGVSWFAARNWVEDRMTLDDSFAPRRFKFAQMGVWMGAVLVCVWVTETAGVPDDAAVMGIFTLVLAPIWFGVNKLLAPRSAQLTR